MAVARRVQRTALRGPATGVDSLGLSFYSRSDGIRDGIPMIYQHKGKMEVSYTA